MNALVINSSNKILFEASADTQATTIEVAGAVTVDGAPINRHTYKLTRSIANQKRASRMELDQLKRHDYNGLVFYVAPTNQVEE
ncbi:hypothetical protein ACW9IK_07010 [Pseudomonas gingeri]